MLGTMFPSSSTAAHAGNCLPPLATMFAVLVSSVRHFQWVFYMENWGRIYGAVRVGFVFSLGSKNRWGGMRRWGRLKERDA